MQVLHRENVYVAIYSPKAQPTGCKDMTQLERKSTEYFILHLPFHFQLVVSNINLEAKIVNINLKTKKEKSCFAVSS